MLNRCAWCPADDQLYCAYHDHEWGVPVHDDQVLFGMLCLEGAQAGLSWRTVLAKRDEYMKVFHNFNIDHCAQLTDEQLESFLTNPGIIRNRLKVWSVRKNALAVQAIQKEFGSFSKYLWHWTHDQPIVNHWVEIQQVPASTELSDMIAKDLKKRGCSFVGTTIIYAYLQAVGVVNDHTTDCFRYGD